MEYTESQMRKLINDLHEYEEGIEQARHLEGLQNNKERAKFIANDPALKRRLDDLIKYVKFDIGKLVMDGAQWHMYINVQAPLDKNHRAYDFYLTADTGPIDRQIKIYKAKIKAEKADRQLFEEEKNKTIENYQAYIKNSKEERDNLIESHEDISLIGYVEQVKFKVSNTEMVVGIPAEVIQQINEHRFDLKNYKLDLRPIAT